MMPNFNVRADIHTLQCFLPTDFGNDEPFMWNFFVRADGTTLRQDPANPGRFRTTLSVVAKPGHHGNLGVSGMSSGSSIPVPDEIGAFETPLRPIEFAAIVAGRQLRGWLPGRLIIIAAVLDEDSTSHSVVNAVHDEVVGHVQIRANEFFGGLDFGPVIQSNLAHGVDALQDAARQFISDQLELFQHRLTVELTDLAIQVAIREATRRNILDALFTTVVNALDHDEFAGIANMVFDEEQLVDANLTMDDQHDVGPTTAVTRYRTLTSAQGRLTFSQSDIETSMRSGEPASRTVDSYTPSRSILCVPEGPIEYWREYIPQTFDLLPLYPFCDYRYSIDGVVLAEPSGTVRLRRTVGIMEFDERGYPFTGMRYEDREVSVQYRFQSDMERPQLTHLVLENNPDDATFEFQVNVEAVLPNGDLLPVGVRSVTFEGQIITFPPGYMERIEKCMEPLVSNRYAKFKRLGLKELWGPDEHAQRLQQVIELIDERASMRTIAPGRVEAVRAAVSKAFNR